MRKAMGIFTIAALCQISASLKTNLELSTGLWNPNDLAAVENALSLVLSNPHLTPTQSKSAQEVAVAVRADIAAVTRKGITKAARKEKVNHAIKLLTGLEDVFNPKSELERKKLALEKKLAMKKGELVKEEAELKLAKMEEQLAKKKLELRNLVAQKMQVESSHKLQAEEANEQAAMASKLVKMAQALAAAKTGAPTNTSIENDSRLQGIRVNLESRAHNVSQLVIKMEASEKANEAALKTAANGTGNLAKGQDMVNKLRREEHRKFEKIRALKKAELAELNESIRCIKKGDVANLKRTLAKMQDEAKHLQAKMGNFLY